jgi:hypothetical protein
LGNGSEVRFKKTGGEFRSALRKSQTEEMMMKADSYGEASQNKSILSL